MGQLTERDLEIALFLGRVKIARPEQLAKRFGMTSRNAYFRLNALAAAGLAASDSMVLPGGAVWYLTADGLSYAGLSWPVLIPTPMVASHDMAATQLIVDLEAADIPCLSERELRAYRRELSDDRFVFAVDDHTRGKLVLHSPDVVCDLRPDHDRFYAIELELTRKNAQRWRDTLTGFKRRYDVDGFGGVLYLADAARSRPEHLRRLAGEAGLDKHFQLQLTVDADPVAGLGALIKADKF